MNKEIKKLAEKYEKKIGKEAIRKIKEIISKKLEEIIKKASRNAFFSGRSVIKVKDIDKSF